MHKKINNISILLLLTLSIPTLAQQFSSKTLVLKTTRYELDVKVDYEAEKIFGKCLLTVNNPADQSIAHIPLPCVAATIILSRG